MKIAISGLGRMGGQIARKLAENGHEVIANNRHREPIDEAVTHGTIAAYEKADVVKAFDGQPVVLWIMIPAEVIESELDVWLDILPTGSIIIDGGNSDYRGDKARADKVAAKGSTLLNYFQLGADVLDFVVDRSTVKQGYYTPGTHLPIYAPEKLLADMPDYVLLLTWNFASEILAQQSEYRRRGGRFVVPIPSVKVI